MEISGADALDYKTTKAKAMELINKGGKDAQWGMLILCGINLGLRISDLVGITYAQLKSGEFMVKEKKTGKKRYMVVNDHIKEGLKLMEDDMICGLGGKCFVSQQGTLFTTQYVNRKLKKYLGQKGVKVSSHSLRKTFGKSLYIGSEKDIALVQAQLNHSSASDTLKYIGVTQIGLNNCFNMIGK